PLDKLDHPALAPVLVPPAADGRGQLDADAVAVERLLQPVLGDEHVHVQPLDRHEPEPPGVDRDRALDDVARARLPVLVAPALDLGDEPGLAELLEHVAEELVALVVLDAEGLCDLLVPEGAVAVVAEEGEDLPLEDGARAGVSHERKEGREGRRSNAAGAGTVWITLRSPKHSYCGARRG